MQYRTQFQCRFRRSSTEQFHPIANSSEDSSGVPQRRQITAEQSPHVSGSLTSAAHTGQYKTTAAFSASGAGFRAFSMRTKL